MVTGMWTINSDRTNIGSPIPLHYYGFSATLDYSGFDLNIQLQGVPAAQYERVLC